MRFFTSAVYLVFGKTGVKMVLHIEADGDEQ
jgi:hypothetical protein